ncbi:uncharacterized protein N7515_006693 [Penicillium bovifimosum]|uniref:Uncharacterized protein n=1 Tax=Penicillium bovifimosum TaxID=126998 RepID=A0A9W9L102_9EURO|nr:uncharacterized protein N7515_006693 [Penicillium bovifimosum]KAJ5130654.1 hypothetical protein N7515_006693 [Penicillium bovifimosum]
MPSMVTGRALLRKPLPQLHISSNRPICHHARASALHNKTFLGPVSDWPNIFQEVKQFEKNQDWSPRLLRWSLLGRQVDAEFVAIATSTNSKGDSSYTSWKVWFADFKSADIADVSRIYPHPRRGTDLNRPGHLALTSSRL